MENINKSLSNISDFNDLIPDEMLAAYIDGNATEEESQMIENALMDDNPYEEVIDIISDQRFLSTHADDWGTAQVMEDIYSQYNIEHELNDTIMSYMKTTGEVQPFPDASPEEIIQHQSDTCAVKSQQIIMKSFGIDIPEEVLAHEAAAKGYYYPGFGSDPDQVGKLLADHGIPVHTQYGANVYDLVDELAQGHKVIVGVDADELWRPSFFNDLFGEEANHALVVTGIDTTDPDNVKVIITDPGTGDVAKEYPLDQFIDAWHDSNCEMVATDIPAPKTFNPNMINFDYNLGHLEQIGDIPYDVFHDEVIHEIDLYLSENNIDDLPVETPEQSEELSSFYDHILDAFGSFSNGFGENFHDILFS